MIKIKTNIGKVVEVNVQKLQKLADTDLMLRTAATTVLGLMKIRIHKDGLDANNQPIGTYSKGYMVVRTGNYQNASRYSRGTKKGEFKVKKSIGDAGVFTKTKVQLFGYNQGVFVKPSDSKPRPVYNRGSDTKVIASLTRQMENDESVIPLRSNSYGIGFSNRHNYDKSQWVEATYKKEGKIFAMSTNEVQAVIDIAQKFTQDAISQ